MSSDIAVPRTPIPRIIIRPHTASPVKDSHIFSPIKNIIAPVKVHFALDRHTIHLLIVIKSLRLLLPRCSNTDAVHLRLLHQKVRLQCLTILKITENTLNSSSMRLHRITKMNPTISEIRIAIVRCPPQSQSSHRHCRQYGLSMFLSFHKIDQRHTDKSCITKIRQSKCGGIMFSHRHIIIPLLDSERRCCNILAIILPDRSSCPTGCHNISLLIQQLLNNRYLMLHKDPSCLLLFERILSV